MWLSAALDDEKVCKEMKDDINNWFESLFSFIRENNIDQYTFYKENK